MTPYPVVHGESGGPFLAYRIEAEGRVITYSADTEWTETLIPAARGADLFIAEAYYYDKIVKNHLSLKTLEAHLPEINAKRLVLTHMSDDMLARLDELPYTLPKTAWSSSSRHAFARNAIQGHDGTGVCHRRSRDGREPDHAADRHRLDHGDRPARRCHAARRRGDGLGAVRLHVLAVRLPAHEHGRLHRAVARRRRDAGIARDPGARA